MIIAKNSKEFKKKNPGGVALSAKRQCHPFGVFLIYLIIDPIIISPLRGLYSTNI